MTNYSIFYLSVIKSSFIGNLTPTSSKLLPLHNPLADLHGHCHTNHHNHDHRNRYLPSGKCIQELETCISFIEFQCFLSASGYQEMTAISATMRIRHFSISYFRRIGSRIARKIPAQIITAPVLMRNSFRELTDCALRSPGIMERMPAASVTPAAVRYLDITYSFLVNGRVIRKFSP